MQSRDRHSNEPPKPEPEKNADADAELEPEKDTPSAGQIVNTDGSGLLYLVGRSGANSGVRESPAQRRVIEGERSGSRASPKTVAKPLLEPPPPAPPVHQIDEYRIVEPLGRGGMGQVFLGRDTLLDRPVAVKFLSSTAPNERLRKRFLVEARAIAKVQHPNVLAVYRVGISNGLPYLVTEHVAGASLDRLPKPMPWEKALRIGIDLLRGLSAVHKQGVLHRDLKPSNAMLTPEGTAKLLDFGLAKLAVELSELPAEFSRSSERDPGSAESAARAASLARRELSAHALSSTYMSGDAAEASGNHVAAHVSPKNDKFAETLDAPEPRDDTDGVDEEAIDKDEHEHEGSSATPQRPLTETGRLLGTPAYMPPEMWLGAPATEQSDLYMFGELLYELCCGHPPHSFRHRIELRRAAIHSDASSLLQAAPTVNPRFAALIDQCIRRSPSERPRSAAELLTELEAIDADPTDEATRRRQRRGERLKRAVPLTLAFCALLFSLSQLVKNTSKTQEPTISAATPRPRVAVLGLHTEDASAASHAGFARAFSELLAAELSAGERLLLLPSASVDHAKLELGIDGRAPSAEGLARLTRSLSLDVIASGVLRADKQNPKRLHVEVTLQDAHTRQITARADVDGPAEELFSLVSTAGHALRKGLGLVELSANSRTQLQATRPASREVAERYAEAKTRFGHFEYAAAQKLFASVVAAEPDFPLGHLGLADVLLALGYEEKARAAVRQASQLAGRLPRAERTLIEARFNETTGDFSKAFGLYNALRTSFPDDAEYGFYLIEAQRRAGLPADALNTVAELRKLNLQGASAARIELAAAKAQMDLSRFTGALASIADATKQAESLGSPLLLADILFLESAARTNLNEPARALRSAERARELFAAMGNLYGEVETLLAQSNAASALGDYAQAATIDERTLQLALELGHTQLIAQQLGNMADSLCLRGRLELATARAQAGLILAEQIGMREAILQALVTLGQTALLRGDLTLAEQHLLRAQRELPTPDDPRMSAWVAWHRAELRIAQGRLEEGLELHHTSLTQREQNGLEGFAAESQAALATLALLREQPAEAARLALAAQQRFVASQNQDSAAWAQALLSQALAEQGQFTTALAAFSPSLERLASSQNLILRVRGISALSAAAVQLPLSKDLQAQLRTQLTAVITQAQQSEFAPAEIELMVRKLALDPAVGPRTAARHEACEVLLRAREKGWRKAAMLAATTCSQTEPTTSAATRTPL